jgi:hypothetical protein
VAGGRRPDLRYVEELVGRGTAVLLSPHTAEAFPAHGVVRPRLDGGLPAARRILASHVKTGVSPKLIAGLLEAESVQRGAEAFQDARALIDDKRATPAAAAHR